VLFDTVLTRPGNSRRPGFAARPRRERPTIPSIEDRPFGLIS
jgi:hypothetical protein